jgi:hypothetical protein
MGLAEKDLEDDGKLFRRRPPLGAVLQPDLEGS